MKWPNATVNLHLNTWSFTDPVDYTIALESGFNSWEGTNVPGSSFQVTMTSAATDSAKEGDGISGVIMGGVVSGSLATTTTWIQVRSPGDTIIVEKNVVFNSAFDWVPFDYQADKVWDANYLYETYSLEAVARHEMGHVIGLHVHEDRPPRVAVMSTGHNVGGRHSAWLHGDDRNGARTFYPGGGTEVDVGVLGWAVYGGITQPLPPPGPNPVVAGEYLTLSYTVENLGTQSVDDLAVGIYLSSSQYEIVSGYFLETSYVDLPGAIGGNSVVPIATRTVIVRLDCSVVREGTYYVWVVANDDGMLSDERPVNNRVVLPYPEAPVSVLVRDGSPVAPSGLTATDGLCTQIDLNWVDNSLDETGFRIYRNGVALTTTAGNVTSYTDTPAAGTYDYEVKAVKGECENVTGSQNSGKRLKTLTLAPEVGASMARCDGIFLDWTWTGEDQAGFRVFRNSAPTPVHEGTDPEERTWLDQSPGLVSGAIYTYEVVAYNACNTGPGDTAPGRKVNPPPTLAVVTTTNGCNEVHVSWTWGGTGQTGFEVWRDNAVVATHTVTTPFVSDTPTVGPHTYRVRAVYPNVCFGPFSLAVDGERFGPPSGTPINVHASDFDCNVVNVTWGWTAPPYPLSGFKIFRDGALAATVADPAARMWPVGGAAVGVPKQYTVRAYNSCPGDGPSSQPDSGTLWATPPSGTLALVASTGGFCCTKIELTWTWSGVGAEGFRIFRDGALADTVSNVQLAWSDTTAAPGTTHSYRVVAVNGCGDGSESTATGTRCPVIVDLQVTSNVPNARISKDGSDITLVGNSVALPCSVCTSHSMSVAAIQQVSGVQYCFDSWGDGGLRSHNVFVDGPMTLGLSLTAGPGPTTFQPGASLPPDLTPCESPYILEGDATALYGLRVHPGVKLRFRTPGTPGTGPVFRVYGSFAATDAVFETTDSSLNNNTLQWSGIACFGASTIEMRRCTVRNANAGLGSNGQPNVVWARVDSCTFTNNVSDIKLEFVHDNYLASRSLRIVGNIFKSKEGLGIVGANHNLYPSEPAVPADVDSNTFTSSVAGSRPIGLTGGFWGTIWGNNMTLAGTGSVGIGLEASGNIYPDVGLYRNRFQQTNNRTAIIAPRAAGHKTISATCNDWGQSNANGISAVITDWVDTQSENPPRAEVIFNPWTGESGCSGSGGGGGGGGGCPFVLSSVNGEYVVENSILGRSELDAQRDAMVWDAYPLRMARVDPDGRIRLRVAELESEIDKIDFVGLRAVRLPLGAEVGVGLDGEPVAYRTVRTTMSVSSWRGKSEPFISPIAPGNAYAGKPGDSLEVSIGGDLPAKRRISINLIPKPMDAPTSPGQTPGVVVRVSPDASGDRWFTLPPVLPREYWSNALLGLDALGTETPARVRVVWNTTHTLGSLGVAELTEPIETVDLPLTYSRHIGGTDAFRDLARADEYSLPLDPGEHVDLEFDGRRVPEGSELVLIVHGRYTRMAPSAVQSAPASFSLEQNRPNPFNPETVIEMGLPHASHVTLRIYDVAGRLVRELVNGPMPTGRHARRWDGRTDRGAALSSGVYFYELTAGSFTARRRMVLLK